MKRVVSGYCCGLVATALLAGDVLAADGASYRVSVSDLDLRSSGGVATLYVRIQAAATVVCGLEQARGYAARRRARRCIGATVAAEVAEIRTAKPGVRAFVVASEQSWR